MSEKQFVIYEMPPGNRSSRAITESELKKRIDRILMLPRPNRWLSMDVDIDILLHGEAKEPKKVVYEHPCGATVEVPATDKWEEWCHEIAGVLGTSREHRSHIEQLLVNMPR